MECREIIIKNCGFINNNPEIQSILLELDKPLFEDEKKYIQDSELVFSENKEYNKLQIHRK